ncbi:hypothetical protein CXB49_05890 [Chromobacterium sp. ATCC 53434]|uniref:energy transducer TonB n=1 Tax=Chromobacterium sp. (strain ATCC 53434 / SC 14030) TaxID=2059672 RepID=UPI000C76F52C|nr:hypothetical protein [Chromobacterium sp. ATCC 53434]AUH50374.1 hypothetical protein CXB49_05890 [Chromobacterium sp. ATCC 53434]
MLLMLCLSLLAHAALLWLPLRPGQWDGGRHDGLRVRLTAAAEPVPRPAPSRTQPAPLVEASAAGPASAPAPLREDGDRLRLGAYLYYSARELDQLAQQLGPITLPDVDLVAPTAPIVALVFIDADGQVDAVRFEGSPPPVLTAAIAPVFRATRYLPARKDGLAVKSYKRIRIEPQLAPPPALSH